MFEPVLQPGSVFIRHPYPHGEIMIVKGKDNDWEIRRYDKSETLKSTRKADTLQQARAIVNAMEIEDDRPK